MPLIPELGKGKWVSEFEANLAYSVSSRTAGNTQKNPVPKKQIKHKRKKEKERLLLHLSLGCQNHGFLPHKSHPAL